MIVLKNLTKVYTRKQLELNVVALDNVNLVLPDKGFVSILGASGSGKTTLLNIIGGLDVPTSGNMIVDGLSTSSFKDNDWDSYRNEKVGFVLQNCYLLPHLNVRDNIAVKLQISKKKYDDIDLLVDSALREVDLFDKKYDKPKTLSGGQKQRVAIARAIINKPTVILADEPTGALDSKTGIQIVELLKELSKEQLVVMVTHNNDYASKYADRVIELKDGKVISDSNPIDEEEVKNNKPLEKVHIPALTSIKWGGKNLVVKKFSTLSIIVAASLGLSGVGLILSISSGVKSSFAKAESKALGKYPVEIYLASHQSPEGSKGEYEEYTSEPYVYVDYSEFKKQEHYVYMSDEFLSYMDDMPKSHYRVKADKAYTVFNIYTQVNESAYRKISYTDQLFYKGIDNFDYIDEEYDCLIGSYPQSKNELALVVDDCNRVNAAYLYALGFDIDLNDLSDKKFSFEEVRSKTYRYVENNDYYVYNSETGIYSKADKTAEQFYNLSSETLQITGILRQKRTNKNPLLNNGVLYSQALEDMIIQKSNESDIVIAQKSFGLSKNVLTGQPFTDYHSGTTNVSAAYQYEQQLYNFGSYERVIELYYFTNNHDCRQKIERYFNKYVEDETVDFSDIMFYDYLEEASSQFDGAIALMTTVLYVFAVTTVIVSAILNGILTYITVHQRTNEIGLLRSMGARKKDIAMMVETESLLCGFAGGIFSILLSIILIRPINILITGAIYDYHFYLLSKTTFDLGGFRWWVAPIIIGVALLTALVSALIPAIVAAKKDPAKAINE